MGRLDVEMYDSLNNWSFREFSLACPFFVKMSGWFVFCITVLIMSCCSFMIVSFFVVVPECFPNGTITVIIPKLESVPHLHPGELSLRDPACKPYDIEDYFAYFHFNVTSCGTTRKVQWRPHIKQFALLLYMLLRWFTYCFACSVCWGYHDIWEWSHMEERWTFATNLWKPWDRIQVRSIFFFLLSFNTSCITKVCPLKWAGSLNL